MGGLVVHPLGWGGKGCAIKIAGGGEPAHDITMTMSPPAGIMTLGAGA